MPNRQVHVQFGATAGLGTAAYRARNQAVGDMLLEALGGVFGGYLGSRLPDLVEPASWPGHRAFVHSATAGASLFIKSDQLILQWEEWCRSNAELCHQKSRQDDLDGLQMFVYTLSELAWHASSGIMAGLLAGYLSHLVLDGGSDRSLPII